MATKQPDLATAAPEQLLGEHVHVEFPNRTTCDGPICGVKDNGPQRILRIKWQGSVVRSVDVTHAAINVSLLDTEGGML